MVKTIDFNEVCRINKEVVFIDVRSPKEFKEERIPGAINIPLFSDEERIIVGTTYKNESKEKAKEVGLFIVSKKLPDIYRKFQEATKNRRALVVYCARGGMRSGSIASLLSSIGFDVYKINGGYKGYRKYIRENLPKIIEKTNFIVLYGNTGTGKTKILKNLHKKGVPVLDLEACANHRGSVLGGVGLNDVHTQKFFESLVYHNLKSLDSHIVITEGESKRIGRIIMPDYLYDKILNGTNIKIEANIESRIENIKEDYLRGENYKKDILKVIEVLKRYISKERVLELINLIENENYETAIEKLMIEYYDPMYNYKKKMYKYYLNSDDILKCCEEILDIYKREKI